MSNWMLLNPEIFKDKKVIELGSGPGLVGFTAGKLGASRVILTDYKEPVMDLIAHNIKHQNHPHMYHAMLDWYFATDQSYLDSLPVLDSSMSPLGTFGLELLSCDLLIGSDLLYFTEAIQPLFAMLCHFWSLNPRMTFYMCMMRRGKETHDELERCIQVYKEKIETKMISKEYMS